jgi:hypothetical protein
MRTRQFCTGKKTFHYAPDRFLFVALLAKPNEESTLLGHLVCLSLPKNKCKETDKCTLA